MSSQPYHLAAVLVGHSGDVKSVAAAPNNALASASRDRTVRLWQRGADGHGAYACTGTVEAHQQYVNAVAYAAATPQFPQGLVLSGGQDSVVYAHAPGDLQRPVWTLLGHGGNVCALAVHGTVLLSGSWDHTARVWDLATGACLLTLQGHEQAVWAVAALDDGTYLTASGDKTIKLWSHAGACLRTFTGHTDAVRGVSVIPGIGFASCANDCTVRVWALDGTLLQELVGHTAFVYSIAYSPATGELVTGGEDRSLRVWSDGQCVQTILHPADSVWSVAVLSCGDIATGANDGIVRVFSRSPERAADPDTVAAFDDAVKSHSIAAESIDPKLINPPEALAQPGRKDGETKLVRNASNVVEAFQWSAAQATWVKVGEVTNVRKDAKKVFDGVEYDYVFDVDVGEGQPMRKLPYNLSENPYMAAQRFLHREEMSQELLDSVAKFIIKNTESARVGQAPPVAHDPYTGSSRYSGGAPMSGVARGAAPAPGSDPFAFSGAYTTSSVQPATSQAPAAVAAVPARTPYVLFEAGNVSAIHQKLMQLNSELVLGATSSLALASQEQQSLALLVEVVGNTSRYHATSLFDNQFAVLTRALAWPVDKRFPVLDLFRLTALHPSFVEHYTGDQQREQRLLDAALVSSQIVEGQAGNEVNQMFGFRTLVNLFKSAKGRQLVVRYLEQILDAVEAFPTQSSNKNLHQALTTLLLNLALLAHEQPEVAAKRAVVLVVIVQELANEALEDDAAARAFTAFATLAALSADVVTMAKQQGLVAYAKFFGARSSGNARLKAVLEQQVAPLLG